jgi:trehalose/maltose hydrolase-like predicted phosphorylase
MRQALEPTQDPSWVLTHEGYNVLTENAVESRFALGNGFLGMRASRPVSRGPTWVSWLGYIRWASWPRCYVAGLFDRPNTVPPVPALVPVADWSRVRLVRDDNPQLLLDGEFLASVRQLDMRRGVLLSDLSYRAHAGITISSGELRLVVTGGPRGGIAAPEVFARPRRHPRNAGGQLRHGRYGHGAVTAGPRCLCLAH